MNDVSSRFQRNVERKRLKRGEGEYDRLFNKVMDACERLGYKPFIDYETKFPDG